MLPFAFNFPFPLLRCQISKQVGWEGSTCSRLSSANTGRVPAGAGAEFITKRIAFMSWHPHGSAGWWRHEQAAQNNPICLGLSQLEAMCNSCCGFSACCKTQAPGVTPNCSTLHSCFFLRDYPRVGIWFLWILPECASCWRRQFPACPTWERAGLSCWRWHYLLLARCAGILLLRVGLWKLRLMVWG